jgi:hypothetical protein
MSCTENQTRAGGDDWPWAAGRALHDFLCQLAGPRGQSQSCSARLLHGMRRRAGERGDDDRKRLLGSERISRWSIPYEIKMTMNVQFTVRNDNPAKRFVVDGGI